LFTESLTPPPAEGETQQIMTARSPSPMRPKVTTIDPIVESDEQEVEVEIRSTMKIKNRIDELIWVIL